MMKSIKPSSLLAIKNSNNYYRERENLRMKKELEEKQIEVSELRIKCDELERMYKEQEENRITTGRNWGRGSLGVNTEGSGPEDWELDMLRSKLAEQDRLIIALKVQSLVKCN